MIVSIDLKHTHPSKRSLARLDDEVESELQRWCRLSGKTGKVQSAWPPAFEIDDDPSTKEGLVALEKEMWLVWWNAYALAEGGFSSSNSTVLAREEELYP